MTATDWRASLSFSDRLASITRIQIAITSAGNPKKALDPQNTAKAHESAAYRTSTSRQQYDNEISGQVYAYEALPVCDAEHLAALTDIEVDGFVATGRKIGDYTNATPHRDGRCSAIYKARSQKQLPRAIGDLHRNMIALKVTRPSAMLPPHDSRREARILLAATGEHVVELLETFVTRDLEFVMVLPFIQLDLEQVLRRSTFTVRQARSVLRDLISALSHIHGLGIIHRDVKPSNILMRDANGPAVLADFGIAWMKGDPASEEPDSKILDVGTTCYRPPELLFGNQGYDQSLDMWAAGCVAAQAVDLGGRNLFVSGDLGSDLPLLKSIFETLGTPDLSIWPEAKAFPDWGKMHFHEYPPKSWGDILPRASPEARDFVSSLVRYESGSRIKALDALRHPFLTK